MDFALTFSLNDLENLTEIEGTLFKVALIDG